MVDIAKLPSMVMEEIVRGLSVKDKRDLLLVNKRFRSIITPALYREAIFFREQPDYEEFAEGMRAVCEAVVPELKGNEEEFEVDFERKAALQEAAMAYNKEQVTKINSEAWKKLLPTIKKYNSMIKVARPVDNYNFIEELETYSDLEEYHLYIIRDEQVEQLKNYKGTALSKLKKLYLYFTLGSRYEEITLIRLQGRLGYEEEIANKIISISDTTWLNQFKLLNLASLIITCPDLNIEVFDTINSSFPNLEYLQIVAINEETPSDEARLPVFHHAKYLNIQIEYSDGDFDFYLTDRTYWPKVKDLAYLICGPEQFALKGDWSTLTDLRFTTHICPNPFQLGNLEKLTDLELEIGAESSEFSIQKLLGQLVQLKKLKLCGEVNSAVFDFQPTFKLWKLEITDSVQCTQLLVDFISTQTRLRSLEILFQHEVLLPEHFNLDFTKKASLNDLVLVKFSEVPEPFYNWIHAGASRLTPYGGSFVISPKKIDVSLNHTS